MNDKTSREDQEFRSHDLEPLSPYTRATEERQCRCTRCGTRRWVKLATLRRKDGVACRWCHGWEKWNPWSEHARQLVLERLQEFGQLSQARSFFGDQAQSLERLRGEKLAPLTEVGDLYQPVGVVCLECGETTVTVPERISADRPGWFGCERCSSGRRKKELERAPELFAANGLRLLGPCTGEYVPQKVECIECGSERSVSLDALRRGSAPLCWTCTHGIRPDEPHRVYLIHFADLGVFKVGITHDRHDRRLLDHQLAGGRVVETVLVLDRKEARRLERLIQARYSAWTVPDVGPEDLPQGGWTETWSDKAPMLDLTRASLLLQG